MTRRGNHRGAWALACLLAALHATPALTQTQPPSPPVTPAPAAEAQPVPSPQIVLADVTEDKQHLLRATVTVAGAPLAGLKVNFGAVRTFGILDLGIDTTLDDGTAAVPFPEGLPGDAAGAFEAVASVAATKDSAGAVVRTRIGGAGLVAFEPEPFPHALWSSRALWPLVTVIGVLLAGVWSVYAFVVVQLIKIRHEENPR